MAKNKGPLKGLPSDKRPGSTSDPRGAKGTPPVTTTPTKPKPKGKGKGGKPSGPGSKGDVNEQMFNFQKREAERAREEEKERKNRIQKGMKKINASFKGFDEDFYAKREEDYKGFYQPQLQDQFKKARENLTFALSRAGTLNSSVAGAKSGELTKDFDVNTALINSKAAADRAATQGRIAEEKSALVSQLNATAAAEQVGKQATARTQQLASEAPDYNPMGDIFFGAAQGVGGLVQAGQNAQYANTFNNGGTPRGVTLTGATTVY